MTATNVPSERPSARVLSANGHDGKTIDRTDLGVTLDNSVAGELTIEIDVSAWPLGSYSMGGCNFEPLTFTVRAGDACE